MGNAQNIQMKFSTRSKTRVYKIQNANLSWGKFYNTNKDDEESREWVNQKTFKFNSPAEVNSCGRNGTSSGTEGSVEIHTDGIKIGRVFWNCPWAAGAKNSVGVVETHEDFLVQIGPYNIDGTEIGRVDITVAKAEV